MATTKQQVIELTRDRFPKDRAECAFTEWPEDDMEFATDGADNPAAYLAALVHDHT